MPDIGNNEQNATSAYETAMRSGDHFTADKLASEQQIKSHEFFNFPPQRDRDFTEVMSEALFSRLRRGATVEKLGLRGFEDRVVADIGTRDGHFVPLFRKLGAAEVFGIDPDGQELEKAISSGFLDREHAINTTLEDIPEALKGKIELGAVLNFNIPISQREGFIKALYDSLSSNGQVVITVAEREIAQVILPILEKYFRIKSCRLWDGTQDLPHAYLIVGSRK